MKKFRNILLIVMTVMTASCVEEMADPAYGEHELSFTASFDSDDDTKTILVDGKDVHWLPGDCISVSGASDAFVSDVSAQCAVTTFTGSALPAETYFAVYPYESVVSWNGEVASVNVPANQTAVKGTFSDDLNISASRASSSDMNMSFHNVLGYMKFTIGEDSGSIRSVEVSAIGGESLAGAAEISYDSRTGQPSLVSTTESQTVTLSSESALEPGDYYIAMIPGAYTEGLTLTFVATDYRVATKEIKTELTLGKGVIQNIGTVKNLTFELPFDTAEIPDDEIWYVTSNNEVMRGFFSDAFDQSVISNTYSDGKGIIKFSGKVQTIKSFAFLNTLYIKYLVLPEGIETLEDQAFFGMDLDSLYVPSNLKNFTGYAFSSCKVGRFVGSSIVQGNGRFIIIGDTLKAVATLQEEELTVPGAIRVIGSHAIWSVNPNVTKVVIEEGVEVIEPYAFSGCKSLEEVYLPNSLVDLQNSVFDYCDNIRQFHGPTKYVSNDGRTTYRYVPFDNGIAITDLKFISNIAKAGLTDYVVEDDIAGIDPESFCRAYDLKTLTINSQTVYITGDTFDECYNLERIIGPGATLDGRGYVGSGSMNIPCTRENIKFLVFAGKGITEYQVGDYCQEIGPNVFAYQKDLKKVIFNDNIIRLGHGVFWGCSQLEEVTLPAVLQYIGINTFTECPNLKTIYMRSPVPPVLERWGTGVDDIFDAENNLGNLKIYVPENSVNIYKNTFPWSQYSNRIYGYTPKYDNYISIDYSDDGYVDTLQTATKGNGIDIVLMGDAYSDREIADGSYEADMEYMYDNFFTQEPFKTHKDMFNVYYVNVVSMTEGYENSGAALGGYFGDGTLVGGNDNKCFEYALNAVSEDRMDEALIIVVMNSDAYAGTCYMYYPESATGTYGSGPSVAYFPKGEDEDMFAQLLHHEANGHGFAKLADEYAYEALGTVPGDYAAETREQQVDWGWWKNVDFTDDVEDVRWSYFLADERYDNEGLGCFEGGLTYWSGVWRPTENSIMRYNTGGFNAPSREAIYYRIHKLAYGDSWEYDYEDFVEYDAVNRTAAASAARRQRVNYVERAFEPTAAPVVTGRSWRQAR